MKTNRSNKLFDQTRIATLGLQDLLAFGQLQPDGTYKVRNVTNSNFLNAIVISEQITYAEILALATASELVAGKNYTITNAVSGTLSLYIFAVSTSKLAEYGYDTTTGQVYSYDLATDTATNADNTGYINFTPQTAPAYQRGRVWYDSTTETLSVYDDISGTSVQLGQEEILRARNSTGSTILNGAVVYVSGAQGQNPRVSLALANAESTSRVIGVATHNIDNNSVGKITTFGIVGDLNTSAYNEGDVLYLSASVAGGLTTTRPSAPNQAVMVGTVIHAAVNDGKILVHTDNYGVGFGTANQVRGMNAAGTAEEYKTIQGTASEVEVLHTANTVTIGLPNAVTISGAMTAGSFVKSGGVSAQFLKADGTVDANAYFYTNAQVTGQALTGLSVSGSAVVSTDSILTGIGKLQNQINAVLGSVNFQGVWNASTNTPTLTSSVGTKGYYYIVTVAGSTNLNGITDWKLGDWAIYDGSAWQKVDNTDAVVSVNGYTGIVTLAAADVGALPTSAISGTTGKLPKFTASGAIGDSIVSESGSTITALSSSNTAIVLESTAAFPLYQLKGNYTGGNIWNIEGGRANAGAFEIYDSTLGSTRLVIKKAGGAIITNGATDTGEAHIFGGSARVNGRLLVNTSGVGNDFVGIKFDSSTTFSQGINLVDSNASAFGVNYIVFRKSDDTYIGNIKRNGSDNSMYVGGNAYLALGASDTENVRITNTQVITNLASNTGENLIVGGSARVNGNISQNTTLSNWTSLNNVNALQNKGGALYNYELDSIILGQNIYISTALGNTYVANGAATTYAQSAGSHIWQTATSGTANTAATLTTRMLLTATELITFGASDTGEAHIFGGSARVNGNVGVVGNIVNNYGISGSTFGLDSIGFTKIANGLLFRLGAISGVTNGFTSQLNASNDAVIYSFDYGNVGIGTSSPSAKLEVKGGQAASKDLLFSLSKVDYGVTSFYQNYSNTFYANGKSLEIEIDGLPLLQLAVNNLATDSKIIFPNGNVGIGTTSPNFTAANRTVLDVNGSLSSIIGLSNGGATNGFMYADSTSINFGTTQNIPFLFTTNNTERMRITSGGNVLIGTTTDDTVNKLQVSGSVAISSTTGYQLISSGNTLFSLGYSGGTLLNRITGTSLFLAENGTPQLTIASGGAATFSNGLTVKSTGYGTIASFLDAANSGIKLVANASVGYNEIISDGNQPFLITVNSAERFRIAGNGAATFTSSVGIGISPSYALHVYNTDASNARMYLQGATNFVATQYGNTGGAFYTGIDDSAGVNFTGTAYKRFIYSAGNYDIGIYRNGTEKITVKSNTINLASLPTSSAGLSTGDIWSDSGTLKIV